jgi:tetratricopeptide (TPR) repeat protein
LAGAAILSGFLLYLKSKESKGWVRVGYLFSLCAVTLVGVFSKENAVAILGIIALYEFAFWKTKESSRAAAWGCLAVAIPIALLLYERAQLIATFHSQPPSYLDNPLYGAGFIQGKLTALAVMGRYVWKLIWPGTLSTDYSYNQIPLASGTLHDWIFWGVVSAILAAALILYKRNKAAFFFVTFAFVVFVPTSNLLFNIGTIMAERFLYLPAIGLTVCVALSIRALSDRVGVKVIVPIVMILITGAWGIRTYVRNKDWRDGLTLATTSAEASPKSYKTHALLAYQLFNLGQSAKNIDAAVAESEAALAILKDIPDDRNEISTYFNADTEYRAKGDLAAEASQNGSGQTSSARSGLAHAAYQRELEIILQALRINKTADERQTALDSAEATPELQYIRKMNLHLYYQLAQTYLKLGDAEDAYRAGLYTRAQYPKDPHASLLTSEAAASAGRKDDAAVALVTGLLITQDRSLMTPLNSLYRNGLDPKGCAFTITANGPVLNNSCEPVHTEICEAYADVIQLMRWDQKADVADQTRSIASRQYGCTEQVLSQGKKIQVFP